MEEFFKGIITDFLSDGVQPRSKWAQLATGSCGPLFLQMQPNLITHMKLVWHSMLVMLLLVLGIGFLQNVMELLADVISIQQIRWPYQP